MNDTKEPSNDTENTPSKDPKPDPKPIVPPPSGSPDRAKGTGIRAWVERVAPPLPSGPDSITFTDPFWLMARWVCNLLRPPEPPPGPDRVTKPEGSEA
jgi:hypothetical protein